MELAMLKKILVPVLLGLMIVACSKQQPQTESANLTVAEISANPADYVGKTVTLTGTAVHVCRITGKRLFLIGDDPQTNFKVTTGPAIGTFDVALEGSDLQVTGVVQAQKVDTAYLDNWESELGSGKQPEVSHGGHGNGKGAESENEMEEAKHQIANMRAQLAESGQDALYFYNLECSSFKELSKE